MKQLDKITLLAKGWLNKKEKGITVNFFKGGISNVDLRETFSCSLDKFTLLLKDWIAKKKIGNINAELAKEGMLNIETKESIKIDKE
ncbi:MAG: hypothetical protein E3J94_01365 [Desulfobacteraceae bacterium]|nr:MAG: hypothetical protein E3J94_01365 [Desulfobacteraceae bacterium]